MSDLGKNVSIGGVILSKEPIEFNMNKPEVKIRVRNTGDRPIQVGSHFHFFEANKALEFDRSVAYGKRLNIAATTAIRFEPGDEIEVSLISYGGKQTVYGFNNLVDGWTGDNGSGKKRPEHDIALDLAIKQGFKHKAP